MFLVDHSSGRGCVRVSHHRKLSAVSPVGTRMLDVTIPESIKISGISSGIVQHHCGYYYDISDGLGGVESLDHPAVSPETRLVQWPLELLQVLSNTKNFSRTQDLLLKSMLHVLNCREITFLCLTMFNINFLVTLDFNKARHIHMRLPSSNSLGATPVMFCRVLWWAINTLAILYLIDPPFNLHDLLRQPIGGWVERSRRDMLDLLLHRNVLNSSLKKQELLSVTRTSGMPNWTNNVWESWMTLAKYVGEASIHLDWESITTRIFLPSNVLVKSMWSLTQRRDGHFHGWSGVRRSCLLLFTELDGTVVWTVQCPCQC